MAPSAGTAHAVFRVSQIDHVEVFVPDRYEAATWYYEILGLTVLRDYEDWAKDRGGPLMISSDDGNTKLALFEGDPHGSDTAGFQLVAFRVPGAAFVEFVSGLSDVLITDGKGHRLTPASVVDHEKAYSIYFHDPYGHQLEITTYDYDATTHLLRDSGLTVKGGPKADHGGGGKLDHPAGGVACLKAAVRAGRSGVWARPEGGLRRSGPVRTAGGVAGGRSQDAAASAGRRAFLLWARR